MSYHVFFSFSSGLAKPLTAPSGTKAALIKHVETIEQTLNLKREKYRNNPVRWESFKRDFSGINDKVLCETIQQHNDWVRRIYRQFDDWSKNPPKKPTEIISPEDAKEFWHGFETLTVPVNRWTGDYYTTRMEKLYEVMRGRPTDGISFETKALTERQAAEVINLFSEFLDGEDRRLDVPNGHDYLASSYDGGYDWCEKCGAVTPEDADGCTKRKCPIKAEKDE